MMGITLYLRSTDKDGRVTFTQLQVWDAALFMDARGAEAAKAGGQASAHQITRAEYLAGVSPKSTA